MCIACKVKITSLARQDCEVLLGGGFRCDTDKVVDEDLLVAVAHDQGGLAGVPVPPSLCRATARQGEGDMVGGGAVREAVFRRAFRLPFHAVQTLFLALPVPVGLSPVHRLQVAEVGGNLLGEPFRSQDRPIVGEPEPHDLDRIGVRGQAGSLLPAAHLGRVESQQQAGSVLGELFLKRLNEPLAFRFGGEESALPRPAIALRATAEAAPPHTTALHTF